MSAESGLASSGRRCGGNADSRGEPCVTQSDCGGAGATCNPDSWVGWYENRGGSPSRFSPRTRRITNDVDDVQCVFAADLDGDGDIDILSASAGDDRIMWYENRSALPVFNVTTGRQFGTIASAMADAADGHVLSAHPGRFNGAEPHIDFRGKALTLQARGEILQPPNGEYVLADHAVLETAPGAWDLTLHGTLIAPRSALVELSTTGGAFAVKPSGTLTAEAYARVYVDAGAHLEGAANVGANATVSFGGDVNLARAPTLTGAAVLDIDIGGALTSSGKLTAAKNSVLSVYGGDVFSVGNLTLTDITHLYLGSSIQTGGHLFTNSNSTLAAEGAVLTAAKGIKLEGVVHLSNGSMVTSGDLLAEPPYNSMELHGTLDLSTGSVVTAGGPLEVALASDVTASTNSGLMAAGNVKIYGHLALNVGSFIQTSGNLFTETNSTLHSDGAEVVSAGVMELHGTLDLSNGSVVMAGDSLTVEADGELITTDAAVNVTGDTYLDGPVSLYLGSTLTAGGALDVREDDPLTALTVGAGSGLFIAGDVSLFRPVVLDVDASFATDGAFLVSMPSGHGLTVGANASISAAGDMTLASPTGMSSGSALAAGGALDNTSNLEFFGAGITADLRFSNRGALAGFGTIEANVNNFHKALFRADSQVVGDYVNGLPSGLCDDGDPTFEDSACEDDGDCGAGVCVKLGRCDDGIPCAGDGDCGGGAGSCKRFGWCDDGTPTTEGRVCSVDANCADTCDLGSCTAGVCSNNSARSCTDNAGCHLCSADLDVQCSDDTDCGGVNGTCATALCDDASGILAGEACSVDSDCGAGFCVQLGKCDGADPTIIPGQACAGDGECGTGRCLDGTTIIEQQSTLVVIGALSNFGTIIGDARVRPLSDRPGETGRTEQSQVTERVQQPTEQGFFVHGHFLTGATALFLMPVPQSVVQVGGDFDAASTVSGRYDMSRAELRMAGGGERLQGLEVMSEDIGPSPFALNRAQPGHYPIGTLRIGPTATTVDLVDNHDNDRLGQSTPEAIYVEELIVEPGATLLTNTYKIYYGMLIFKGHVDNPDNLRELVPVPLDLDQDLDVDLDDYRLVDACVDGPGQSIPEGMCTVTQFALADSDDDNDVDLVDIQVFQIAFTGE